VVDYVVKIIERDLLPKYPNVDGVVGLNHLYGCGVAINAPAAVVPIRTIHNIALNPNFGGEVMVIGLGCEKLQPAPAAGHGRCQKHPGGQRQHRQPAG
jgi:galactarate dehydratase